MRFLLPQNGALHSLKGSVVGLVIGLLFGTTFVATAQDDEQANAQKPGSEPRAENAKKENKGKKGEDSEAEIPEEKKESELWVRLRKRKKKLDKWRKKLQKQQKRMDKLKTRLENRQTKLKGRVQDLAQKEGPCALVGKKILEGEEYNLKKILPPDLYKKQIEPEERLKRIKKLAGKLKQMRAANAAGVFARLEPELAVEVLARINSRNSGAIMNEMPPKKAAELSDMLVNRKMNPFMKRYLDKQKKE